MKSTLQSQNGEMVMAEAAAKRDSDPKHENESAEPKKKSADWVGRILLLMALLNGAALVGMGLLLQKLWVRIQEVGELAKKPVVTETEAPSPTGKELQPQTLGVLYPLEGFLVNVASEDGPKYLQLRVELELGEPSLEEEVSRKKPAIRDSIIVLLSSRTFNQLRAPNALKVLRSDMLLSINHLLTSGQIKAIYFTQFHFN
jgi:flagellar protein FliL